MPSTAQTVGHVEGRSAIEASLNYLLKTEEKPVAYTYTPPPGIPQTTRQNDPKTVTIHNARPLLNQLSLDTQGFVLTHHESKVVNFYDEAEVREIYYPEVEGLLKEATGAVKVVIFDHVVRCAAKARPGENAVREPAKLVHNDYSLKSAPRRVHDHVPEEAEELLRHRFVEINVWRAIRGPIQESPLALCDARSIAQEDVVPTDLVYPHRVGETYSFTYNPNHRWFYFPDMQRSEAVLLKCYDSKEDGRARFTAHTSFADPTSPPDAQPRESIEVRALVFFAPEHQEAKSVAVPGRETSTVSVH
jgi:hypothetical protein